MPLALVDSLPTAPSHLSAASHCSRGREEVAFPEPAVGPSVEGPAPGWHLVWLSPCYPQLSTASQRVCNKHRAAAGLLEAVLYPSPSACPRCWCHLCPLHSPRGHYLLALILAQSLHRDGLRRWQPAVPQGQDLLAALLQRLHHSIVLLQGLLLVLAWGNEQRNVGRRERGCVPVPPKLGRAYID